MRAEKGIELETATATEAAAAAATAAKAKANEKRSREMFSSTEELMKFQFMSMSLSYFSSLSMLRICGTSIRIQRRVLLPRAQIQLPQLRQRALQQYSSLSS